jgi:hypothetical protein
MNDQLDELEAMESGVRQGLDPIVAEFKCAYSTADKLLRCLGAAAIATTEASRHHSVRSLLLPRLADDLRAVWLLAELGYAVQAAAMGASAVETAVVTVKVGRSDAEARRWLDWEHLDRLPWSIKTACQSLDDAGGDGLGAGTYVWYQSLCLAKHANPRFQQILPASFTPSHHLLNADPTITPRSTARTILGLFVPLQMAVLAVMRMDGKNLELPESCSVQLFATLIQEYQRIVAEVFPRIAHPNQLRREDDTDC